MTDLVFLTEAEARRRTEACHDRRFLIDHRGPGDYAVTDAQHGDRVVASADSLSDAQLLAAAHERAEREPQRLPPPSLGTLTGADYAKAETDAELPDRYDMRDPNDQEQWR